MDVGADGSALGARAREVPLPLPSVMMSDLVQYATTGSKSMSAPPLPLDWAASSSVKQLWGVPPELKHTLTSNRTVTEITFL